jgi:hypothetical protein
MAEVLLGARVHWPLARAPRRLAAESPAARPVRSAARSHPRARTL